MVSSRQLSEEFLLFQFLNFAELIQLCYTTSAINRTSSIRLMNSKNQKYMNSSRSFDLKFYQIQKRGEWSDLLNCALLILKLSPINSISDLIAPLYGQKPGAFLETKLSSKSNFESSLLQKFCRANFADKMLPLLRQPRSLSTRVSSSHSAGEEVRERRLKQPLYIQQPAVSSPKPAQCSCRSSL